VASILVVEDDEQVRVLVESFLADEGHHTLSASTAEEAIALLEGGAKVDLLFVDITLHGDIHGGLTLAQRVVEARPDLKVLYTTGRGITRNEGVIRAASGLSTEAIFRRPAQKDVVYEFRDAVARSKLRTPPKRPLTARIIACRPQAIVQVASLGLAASKPRRGRRRDVRTDCCSCCPPLLVTSAQKGARQSGNDRVLTAERRVPYGLSFG
jgi:CheY-like chemotaxis protein